MKVIIICIVLFALTYNVNGAPADNVENNDLVKLLKSLSLANIDQYGSETAPAADDDDKVIEALVIASLLSERNDAQDIEGFFDKIKKGLSKFGHGLAKAVKYCMKNQVCKKAVQTGVDAAIGAVGKK